MPNRQQWKRETAHSSGLPGRRYTVQNVFRSRRYVPLEQLYLGFAFSCRQHKHFLYSGITATDHPNKERRLDHVTHGAIAKKSTTNQRKEHRPSLCWKVHFSALGLQRCRWQNGSIFIRLPLLFPPKSAKSGEILQKIRLCRVQGHPMSSIMVSIESAYATSY